MASAPLISGYLALGSALSANNVLTELSGSGYARIATTVTYDASGKVITISGSSFGPFTGATPAIAYLAVFDAASGGNLVMTIPWTEPAQASGATLSVPTVTVKLSAALAASTPGGTVIGTTTSLSPTVSPQVAYSVTTGLQSLALSSAGVWSASSALYSPLSQPPANFRNLLDGGDFSVNPWQRNFSPLSNGSGVIAAAITSTPKYFPDRWFAVGGASSSILLANISTTAVLGFNAACQLQRSSGNSNTAAINFGQVLEPSDVVRVQGQAITFSFYALAGSGFSGTTLTAQIISGTGNVANTTAANLASGGFTGSTVVATGAITPTTGFVRYQITGTVPAGATQLGVLLSYTPSGTAGASDYLQFIGLQLEIGSVAGPFEHRDAQVELEICQRYAWVTPEPGNGVVVGSGTTTAANTQVFYMATPVTLWSPPTVTVVSGGFKIAAGAAFATATITPGSTHTVNAISIGGTVTAAAGVGALLAGGGAGTGYILASSDF